MNWRLGIALLAMHGAALVAAVPSPMEHSGDSWVARQPEQGMEAHFYRNATAFRHRQKHFTMRLEGHVATGEAAVNGNRIDLPHGEVTEWFINTADGLEHGFTVARDWSAAPLQLAVEVSGDYTPAIEAGEVVLRGVDGSRLHYGGLKSWDATGRLLASRAEVRGRQIHLLVDDAGAQYPVTVDPIFQEPTMLAQNPAANDRFGYAVAISGDTAVIGAPYKNSFSGVAYVYVRSNGAWVEQTRLTPPAGTLPLFGFAVAISGDTILIGAPAASGTSAAYFYTRTGSTWTEQARFVMSRVTRFGYSVALEGDTALIGAPLDTIEDGAVYVLKRSGTNWNEEGKLTTVQSAYKNSYGFKVALSGDTAVVGAPASASPGTAEVWIRNGTLWSRQATLGPAGGTQLFGTALAISGDLLLVGAPNTGPNAKGAVHVFTRSGTTWTQQSLLTASDALNDAQFGHSLALRGDLAVIGSFDQSRDVEVSYLSPELGRGAAYLFARNGGSWIEARLNLSSPHTTATSYGFSVALDGEAILVGSPGSNSSQGESYSFRVENVRLQSTPTGRSFTLSGPGCGKTGTFVTPYAGFWSTCTVQWTTPVETADTRYTFLGWTDGAVFNPRTFVLTPNPLAPSLTPAVQFRTEYQLTTTPVPTNGGVLSGAGWYVAGTNASVSAAPLPGFVFAGFGGAASGVTSPQTVLMDGPKTVTGTFASTPPAILSGLVTAKAGSSGGRSWVISLTNMGPGVAYDAHLFVLMFVQNFGTPCTALPFRRTPALPLSVGTLAPGQTTLTNVLLDFSGCPANARFNVSIGYASNGGASGGVVTLVNQFQ